MRALLLGLAALVGLCAGVAPASASTGAPPTRVPISGEDRYATAAAVAKMLLSHHPEPATVPFVIVSGKTMADNVVAGPFASKLGGVILLVGKSESPEATDAVPDVTRGLLEEYQPKTVYIVGGESAVSAQTASALGGITGHEPTRIGGVDRYQTAVLVANTMRGPNNECSGATCRNLVVSLGRDSVSQRDFDLALLASARGAIAHAPLLLVDRSAGLPDATSVFLGAVPGDASVSVVGGTEDVPQALFDAVQKALPNDVEAERIPDPADAAETGAPSLNTVTMGLFASVKPPNPNGQVFAAVTKQSTDGYWSDAITAAPIAGFYQWPLVLLDANTCADPEGNDLRAWLSDRNPSYEFVVGGVEAVRPEWVDECNKPATRSEPSKGVAA